MSNSSAHNPEKCPFRIPCPQRCSQLVALPCSVSSINPVFYDQQASLSIFKWGSNNSAGTNMELALCNLFLGYWSHWASFATVLLLYHLLWTDRTVLIFLRGIWPSIPQVFVISSALTLCPPLLHTLTCIFSQFRWLFLWELCTGPSTWGGTPSAELPEYLVLPCVTALVTFPVFLICLSYYISSFLLWLNIRNSGEL